MNTNIMKALLTLWTAILTISTVSPVLTATVPNPQLSTEITQHDNWKIIKTDIVTLMFPANGSKPIFVWWYTRDNGTVYVVNFKGLWEYATINLTEFSAFKRKYGMTPQLINETLIEPEVEELEELCEELEDIMEQTNITTPIMEDLSALILEGNSTLTEITNRN